VRDEWGAEPLGDLCDVLDHKRKPITKSDRVPGKYPYFGATGVLDHVDGYLFDEPLVLVGEDGAKWESGERTAFAVDGKCWVNNHAHVLRVYRSRLLDKWLIHYLNHTDLSAFVSGLTVPKLNQGNLRIIPVPVPPLPRQELIVGILDEAFEGIATARANAEKNRQSARALFESHLDSVFAQPRSEWLRRPLRDFATFRNGINFTKASQGELVKIVGVKDFQSHFWAPLDNLDTVTANGVLPDSDTLRDEDLLFVRSNGNVELIGRCLLVGTVRERITHSGFTIRARLTDGCVTPRFLCYFLKSSSARRAMIDGGTGTSIKSLNQATLSALTVPVPPISEQNRIVERIEALRAETQGLVSISERKVEALDALKKSLLHLAFTGQLGTQAA
jgi:type I restriction enzyme S subunit